MKSIRTVLIALITVTTLVIFSVQAYFTLSQFKNFASEQIKINLLSQAEKEASKIYTPMRDNANNAANLAALAGSMKEYNQALIFEFMKKIVGKNEMFSGYSLALEPGVSSPEAKFYLPYIYKDKNNMVHVDWSYNGTQYFSRPWYKLGMTTSQRYEISPPYRDNMGVMWISIASPVIRDDQRIGVATADLIIDSLCEYVTQLKVGQNGYAYLITPDGIYLGKDKQHLNSFTEKISNERDPEIRAMAQAVLAAEQSGLMQLKKAGQIIAYAPIGETGIKLVLVYMEDEILGELNEALITNAIGFMITIIVFIVILAFVINRRMVNPLGNLAQLVNQVASGDLTPFKMDYNHKDEIGLVYTNFQDMVIALKTAREQLENQKNSLATKNAELERFTYTVSHDLRSPLITIKGFAGVIAKEIAKEKYNRVQSDLHRIENAADKMAELLEGLLELSRIGRIANVSEIIPMTELSKQVVELLHEDIQSRDIHIEIQEDMPDVFGDKNRIREVIQNLVENAVKFMDRPDGMIRIGCLIKEENVYFVNDNGRGIDPQYQKEIFELFDKLDSYADGSGIGLALVKRIIEYHGGQIWVESKLGGGATFFFTVKTTSAQS